MALSHAPGEGSKGDREMRLLRDSTRATIHDMRKGEPRMTVSEALDKFTEYARERYQDLDDWWCEDKLDEFLEDFKKQENLE